MATDVTSRPKFTLESDHAEPAASNGHQSSLMLNPGLLQSSTTDMTSSEIHASYREGLFGGKSAAKPAPGVWWKHYAPGDVAAGFNRDCLPFTIMSGITTAFFSLNLVVAWLLYGKYMQTDFNQRLTTLESNTMNKLLKALPLVWKISMVVTSCGYAVYVTGSICLFFSARKRFKDKRDGVPLKKRCVGTIGLDLLLCLQTLSHDLPLLFVLTLLNAACSCHWPPQLDPARWLLYGVMIWVLLLTQLWKLYILAWNSGCCRTSQRYSCSPAAKAVRSICLMLWIPAFLATILNFILTTPNLQLPFKGGVLHNEVFETIGLQRWQREAKFSIVALSSNLSTGTQTSLHDVITSPRLLETPCSSISNKTVQSVFNRFPSNDTTCKIVAKMKLDRIGNGKWYFKYQLGYKLLDKQACKYVTDQRTLAIALPVANDKRWVTCPHRLSRSRKPLVKICQR